MAMWVFGYGSLLWNPGFDPVEQVRADLPGFARSFCMLSIHHRGTPGTPGLVLALDAAHDDHCRGMALRVADDMADQVLQDLRERELISSAYIEQWVDLDLTDGRSVNAVTYVVDRDHEQYCQHDLETQAQIIANAVGGRGPNTEYLYNTASLLHDLGIADPDLDWLAKRVRELAISP